VWSGPGFVVWPWPRCAKQVRIGTMARLVSPRSDSMLLCRPTGAGGVSRRVAEALSRWVVAVMSVGWHLRQHFRYCRPADDLPPEREPYKNLARPTCEADASTVRGPILTYRPSRGYATTQRDVRGAPARTHRHLDKPAASQIAVSSQVVGKPAVGRAEMHSSASYLAETDGFEPPNRLRSLAFKDCASSFRVVQLGLHPGNLGRQYGAGSESNWDE
jgi:hypothetical protein